MVVILSTQGAGGLAGVFQGRRVAALEPSAIDATDPMAQVLLRASRQEGSLAWAR
jgi:hypothetical protein